MKNLILLSILSISLCLASCGDDNGPVINITSPSSGATFLPGGEISLAGSVTDDVEVSTVNIAIDGGLLSAQNVDLSGITDKTNIPLSGITITLDATTTAGDYNLTLIATDNDGNSEEETVGFKVQ
jgi:hypothetical protein